MSDTVKLIIEIPKEMMKALEVGNFGNKYNPYDVCWLVRNGIPLDDMLDRIRAEILVLDDADYDFEGYYKAVTDALHIIDKYKAESEDKE